jgi:putative FmdB family regulatory protein
MPLYEYKCDSCGATFEVIQRFSDPPVEQCRVCGGPVHKVLSAAAIQFKGSGWYVTDYAKKGMAEASKPTNGKSSPPASSDSSKASSESSSTPAATTSSSSSDKKSES